MSEACISGRQAPTPPPPFTGKAEEPAGAYSWNAPRHAVLADSAQPPSVVRYRDLEGRARSISLFDLAGQKDVRDSELRLLRRRLSALPQYIRRYYAQRHDDITKKQGDKKASEWLRNSFGRFVLPRIDGVNDKYSPVGNLPAALMGLRDNFNRIPYAGKRELKRLAYLLAETLTTELMRETEYQHQRTGNIEFSIVSGYGRAGWLVSHLNMSAPGWAAYCKEELTADDALRAAARIESPAWWLRRLRRLHDRWREHLMIAAGYVHGKASPYCSEPCMSEWLAQKRANREYLKAMELEDQDTGERVSLLDKVDGSVANPAIRRAELMVRMRGFEDLAKAEGMVGAFFTLTAPSKYHSMQQSGRRNNKYNGASPRDTQRYLCRVWSRVRAKWKREGIRTFGFRVCEPHHDATPHWHALLFFLPDELDSATEIFREHALSEDGNEKGAQEARFKMKLMDDDFGSATGYIAKYIAKNIDGYALDGEADDETGKPLKDMAKRVSAWASRWCIRQFQQIGGAPVTVYRELRRLRDRDLWLHPDVAPAHVAADSGDWAGYTTAQGGPLVARDCLRVRLSYEVTEKANDYGDDVSKITGVYSPYTPAGAVIFTRTASYKIVPQRAESAVVGFQEVDLPGGLAAPRSSVNNYTREPRIGDLPAASEAVKSDRGSWEPGSNGHAVPFEPGKMTRKQRRELNDRLRQALAGRRSAAEPAERQPVRRRFDAELVDAVEDFAVSIGFELNRMEAEKLAAGETVMINGINWLAHADGTMRRAPRTDAQVKSDLMSRVYRLANRNKK